MSGPQLVRSCRAVALAAILLGVQDPALAAGFDVRDWPMPSVAGKAAQPDLSITPHGEALLAWVERRNDGTPALKYSRTSIDATGRSRGPDEWQAPRTIAEGSDWFVNWADTPHLLALDDGTLWAHWLQRNGSGVYDYGIALTRSADGGTTWSEPIRIEPPGAKNDYGFVAMWPHAPGTLGIAWLDSRQKSAGADHHAHDGHAGGAMMLRAAVFDANGNRTVEWPLDRSTCDCCTTAAALTARGPVLAYRGRSEGEIRDIRLVRFDGDRWSEPKDVHADGWKFAGCPVNGPAVAARGNMVWVAWYTEAEGKPSLRIARSIDAGDRFDPARHVADGEGLLGRAALALEGNTLWLAWLAERAGGRDGQQLWLARIDARSGAVESKQVVAELAARGRATGLPRLLARDGEAHLVITDFSDGQTRLRGLRVR